VKETSSNFEPEMPDIAVITKCVTSTGIRNTDGVLGEFVVIFTERSCAVNQRLCNLISRV